MRSVLGLKKIQVHTSAIVIEFHEMDGNSAINGTKFWKGWAQFLSALFLKEYLLEEFVVLLKVKKKVTREIKK